MRRAISNTDWRRFFLADDADSSAVNSERELLRLIRVFVPSKVIRDENRDHAWLDDNCKELVRRKREAFGTDEYIARRDECTAGLLAAYNAFVVRTRTKLIETVFEGVVASFEIFDVDGVCSGGDTTIATKRRRLGEVFVGKGESSF